MSHWKSWRRAASKGSMTTPSSWVFFSQLPDSFVKPDYADDADLDPKVAQQPADIVLDGYSLLLQQPARGQQNTTLLADQRLDVHRPEQIESHHLSDPACIVAVGLVHLCLEKGLRMPGLDADCRQASLDQAAEQPLR